MKLIKLTLAFIFIVFINSPYILGKYLLEDVSQFFFLDILINFIITALIMCLPFVDTRRFYILLTPWFGVTFILFEYLISYKNIITPNALAWFLAMNGADFFSFALSYLFNHVFVILISLISIASLILIKPVKIEKKNIAMFMLAMIGVLTFALKNVLYKKIEKVDLAFLDTNCFYQPIKMITFAQKEKKVFFDNDKNNSAQSHRFIKRFGHDDDFLHVLIVGGVQNKTHWSLYGFTKSTTPHLEAREDLVVFKNVMAVSLDSQKNLDYALTLNINNSDVNVFKMVKDAGINIISISNRPMFGDDEIYKTISTLSNKRIYLNYDLNNISYDQKVVEALKNEIETNQLKKTLVVLNLIGAQGKYSRRYPQDFGQYQDETDQLENQYYNLIQYNDQIINEIISYIESKDMNSFVLYFSNPLNNFENMIFEDEKRYEIPLLVWTSFKYQKKSDILYKKIIENQGKPLSMTDFSQSFLEMMRVEVDKLSFFNKIDRSYRTIEDEQGRMHRIQ